MAIQVPNTAEVALLDEIHAILPTSEVRLFQNNLTISATTVIGDFTEATYSGYAAQTSAWTTPATDGSGRAHTQSDVLQYAHSGGATANTIYGYYVVSSGGDLLFAEKFASSITMDDSTDAFNLQIDFRLREDS